MPNPFSGSNPFSGDTGRRKRREKEWRTSAREQGLSTEEYNRGRRAYLRRGEFPIDRETRSESARKVSRRVGGADVTEFPTTTVERKPIRLGPRQIPVYTSGDDGLERMGEMEPGSQFLPVSKTAPKAQAMTYHYTETPDGGLKVVNAVPRVGASDQWVRISSRPGGGRKSPQQTADEITVRGYEVLKRQRDMFGERIEIPEDYMREYLAARKRLGLPPPAGPEERPQPPAAPSAPSS